MIRKDWIKEEGLNQDYIEIQAEAILKESKTGYMHIGDIREKAEKILSWCDTLEKIEDKKRIIPLRSGTKGYPKYPDVYVWDRHREFNPLTREWQDRGIATGYMREEVEIIGHVIGINLLG